MKRQLFKSFTVVILPLSTRLIKSIFGLKIILISHLDFVSFQSFVVAVIVPDQEVLEPWARTKKIQGDFAKLCESEVKINVCMLRNGQNINQDMPNAL